MNFINFKNAVAKQFALMSNHDLFTTTVEKDDLWATYLGSFHQGSNPIYRERTEHDCSCCKQFIRAIGNVVTIHDGKLISIWDLSIDDEPEYQVVADALAKLVKSKPIDNFFFHSERVAGMDKNFEQLVDRVQTWHHFYIDIPAKFVNRDPGTKLSELRASHDVFQRSLDEITEDAVDTVLEFITQNCLYRGEENRFAVEGFKTIQNAYNDLSPELKSTYVWRNVANLNASVSRIRNTAIGTLLVDLSEGKDLEYAVKSFEAKVAPTNYKRPTALVTKAMIEKAKQKIEELGFTSALERRYAQIGDITINNVLFADRDSKSQMSDSVFDILTSGISEKPKSLDKVEDVGIEKFLVDILPKATSIELMVENNHVGNLVSLVAPVNPTAACMFKWSNRFSWSYNGELADSIKERVKQAGGNVTGDVCCRLAWDNTDDLDFYMREPDGQTISFMNRQRITKCGGMLDVDANGCDGQRKDPAENIFYSSLGRMMDGNYELKVNQYSRRSTKNPGFTVEIDVLGTLHSFTYDKVLKTNQTVDIAVITVKDGKIEVKGSLPSTQRTKEVWGIQTNTFRKVNVMMMSPNYWDGKGVGNKHYFFMLDGCINDGQARGFYNEFLMSELDAHRKVIEMVGSKMKTDESNKQLSGVGF